MVLQKEHPPTHPALHLLAGLRWFQKHLEVFSVATLWGTGRHSCSRRLHREGGLGGGFHKNCSDPLLERKMECPSFSSGATWSEAFKLGNTTRSFMPFPPQFVFFKRGRTSFSHFVQPSELPQVQSCRQEQHQGWGGGAGRGGRWRVHSDKTRPSCQSLLQQLLPLLFPQGLQVIRPLQGSLSENRVIFKRAVSHLSTITLLSYYS